MTAEATTESVRGDFSGATLRQGGVTARMDRDARGGYQMTFTSPGAPPRTVDVVRTVGSRRYQQYLARDGDTYWRLPVAWQVEEQRWFPMTGAFLFSDPWSIRSAKPPGAAPGGRSSAGATSIGTSPAGTTTASSATTSRPTRRAIPAADGSTPPSPSWASPARPATARAPSTSPATAIRCAAGRCESNGGADPTIVNPSRLTPARAADLCGRCHGQRIADQIEPLLEHGDPFVPGDDLAIESAPLWRDTPLHGDRRGLRGALLGRRHAAPDRLRVPGPPAVALHHAGAAHLHQLPRHARGRSARADSGPVRGEDVEHDVHRLPHGAGDARGGASPRAPRSGGRRGRRTLRLLPHAPDRLRRARRAPQPPDRGSRAGAGRRRRSPRRLHELSRRTDRRLGRGGRAQALGWGAFCVGRARSRRGRRRSRRCSAVRRWHGRRPPTRSAGLPLPTPTPGRVVSARCST